MTTSVTTHTTCYAWADSPIGRILLAGDEQGLSRVQVNTPSRTVAPDAGAVEDADLFRDAVDQLNAYFAGDLQHFDLKLNPQGTEFQQRAWIELRKIPFGETITYGEQARRLGDPNACRAVGAANGQNPLGIIVPCHRVIGSTGKLTGFAGGLDAKAWLLQHESGLFHHA
jgi:methylated-DNA-[protein]-cysteine S-methyltransferase